MRMHCMDPNMTDGDILLASSTRYCSRRCYNPWVGSLTTIDHVVRTKNFLTLKDCICLRIGIPFETESELRDKGSSKTPDVLLQCPIGVQVGEEWRVVHWIDSKVTAQNIY